MKIAYIVPYNIYGSIKNGGVLCARRNLDLLKNIFGEDNVSVCILSKHHEELTTPDHNSIIFYSGYESVFDVFKRILTGRRILSKEVEDNLIKHALQFECEIVAFEYSFMGVLQERFPKKIKQVLFMQNIEKDFASFYSRNIVKNLLLYLLTKKSESKAVANADIVVSLNNRDAELLKKYYKRNADLILPITLNDNFVAAKTDPEKLETSPQLKLLFVGSLMPPNEKGVTWFVDEVMPHVNAKFTVVGMGFEKLTNKLTRSNVEVIGIVDDLSYYYNQANAVVSPILFGAGMKVKTAEAMMYGKTIFATNEALEGYDVDGIENIYRCNNAEDFINEINDYANKPHYPQYDESVRTLFLKKHHTPSYVPILKKLLLG